MRKNDGVRRDRGLAVVDGEVCTRISLLSRAWDRLAGVVGTSDEVELLAVADEALLSLRPILLSSA